MPSQPIPFNFLSAHAGRYVPMVATLRPKATFRNRADSLRNTASGFLYSISMHRNSAHGIQPANPIPHQSLINGINDLFIGFVKRLASKVKGLVSDYLFSALIHAESLRVLCGRFHSYFPRGL